MTPVTQIFQPAHPELPQPDERLRKLAANQKLMLTNRGKPALKKAGFRRFYRKQ
ncbi:MULTISPECIES: hypothetical protein [Pseudomonas]|jgi:hypothetical protein|uniref:hypothetical protein n=1 Tax=Pseudomonas TaxID=286 RepID=UPI00147B54FA|nr:MULTISPECIES: hypothetical protein [Pseudomonas]